MLTFSENQIHEQNAMHEPSEPSVELVLIEILGDP